MKKVPMKRISIPRIGAEHEGGVFSGICAGTKADHKLITGPEIEAENYNALVAAVAKLPNGPWKLPTRKQQAVQFGNVPKLFQPKYYASCDKVAGDPDYAWVTYFGGGDQYFNLKNFTCRARPVRSLPI